MLSVKFINNMRVRVYSKGAALQTTRLKLISVTAPAIKDFLTQLR